MKLEAVHLDSSSTASDRNIELRELAGAGETRGECRVMSNCWLFSEGVDCPEPDERGFLDARDNQVDVVQAVGRVMRKAPGKKYGYIIVPVVVPAGARRGDALEAGSDGYRTIGRVLRALQAPRWAPDRGPRVLHPGLRRNKTPPPRPGGGVNRDGCSRPSTSRGSTATASMPAWPQPPGSAAPASWLARGRWNRRGRETGRDPARRGAPREARSRTPSTSCGRRRRRQGRVPDRDPDSRQTPPCRSSGAGEVPQFQLMLGPTAWAGQRARGTDSSERGSGFSSATTRPCSDRRSLC